MSIKWKKILLKNTHRDNLNFINRFSHNNYDLIVNKLKFISRKIYYSWPFNTRHKIQDKLIIQKKYKDNPKFNSVYFELRTKCNSKCTFCKASIFTDDRPDISMDFKFIRGFRTMFSNFTS